MLDRPLGNRGGRQSRGRGEIRDQPELMRDQDPRAGGSQAVGDFLLADQALLAGVLGPRGPSGDSNTDYGDCDPR